jgi:subtilisin-like proprotein convertase family protein
MKCARIVLLLALALAAAPAPHPTQPPPAPLLVAVTHDALTVEALLPLTASSSSNAAATLFALEVDAQVQVREAKKPDAGAGAASPASIPASPWRTVAAGVGAGTPVPGAEPGTMAARVLLHARGLQPGVSYSVRVRGLARPTATGAGDDASSDLESLSSAAAHVLSPWSGVLEGCVTEPPPLPPPTLLPLRREDVGSNEVVLRWTWPPQDGAALEVGGEAHSSSSAAATSPAVRCRAAAFLVELRPWTAGASGGSAWTPALPRLPGSSTPIDARQALLSLGSSEAAYEITCGEPPLRATNAMLALAQEIATTRGTAAAAALAAVVVSVIAARPDGTIPNPPSSSSSCNYTFRAGPLSPLSLYEFRVSAVDERDATRPASRLDSSGAGTGAYADLRTGTGVPAAEDASRRLEPESRFRMGAPAPASSRVRTRALARAASTLPGGIADDAGGFARAEARRGSGVGVAPLPGVEALLRRLRPSPVLCPGGGGGVDAAHLGTAHSSLAGGMGALALASPGSGARAASPPGRLDPVYLPGTGEGGRGGPGDGGSNGTGPVGAVDGDGAGAGMGDGSPGLVVLAAYTEGGEVPVELPLAVRYRPSSPSAAPTPTRTLARHHLLEPFAGDEEGQPTAYLHTVPAGATRLLVSAWGAGGGCGARSPRGNTSDDGSALHPPDLSAPPPSAPLPSAADGDLAASACVPGGHGAFLRAWIRVEPGQAVLVVVGTGGAAGWRGGRAGWPGAGEGGGGGIGRKRGGGGGGASGVYLLKRDERIDVGSARELQRAVQTRIPALLAAGGGGGGASDFDSAAGGNGGTCAGGEGDTPPSPYPSTFSRGAAGLDGGPSSPLTSEGSFDPLLGPTPSNPAYHEHIDSGQMPEADYGRGTAGGTAGAGGSQLFGGAGGRRGTLLTSSAASAAAGPGPAFPSSGGPEGGSEDPAGLFESSDGQGAARPGVDAAGPGYGPSVPSAAAGSGGWLRGGSGGDGYEGGGGGGGGLFGGGGGGAGIDGGGGGGGSSYIHAPAVIHWRDEVPTPSPPVLSALNAVSALLKWDEVLWPPPPPLHRQRMRGAAVNTGGEEEDEDDDNGGSSPPRGQPSVRYVLERAPGLAGSASFARVWEGTGTRTRVLGLVPRTPYRFRLAAVSAAGNVSHYSAVLPATTPDYALNTWRAVEVQPALDADVDGRAPSGGQDPSAPEAPRRAPPALRGASLTTVGRYTYMFGGLSPGYDCADGPLSAACSSHEGGAGGVRSETWRLDSRARTWYRLPVPAALAPPPRERHSAAAIDGRIYVVGGRSHPDVMRDGGPFLEDMWVLEMGESLESRRLSVHEGATTAPVSANGRAGGYDYVRMAEAPASGRWNLSCRAAGAGAGAGAGAAACGLPELTSPILALEVVEEPTPDGYRHDDHAYVPQDSCVEDVRVWAHIVHPCLRDLEVRLLGPGPVPYRQPHEAAANLASAGLTHGTGWDTGPAGRNDTTQTVGLQEVLLFSGGHPFARGSAGADHECAPFTPTAEALAAAGAGGPRLERAGSFAERARRGWRGGSSSRVNSDDGPSGSASSAPFWDAAGDDPVSALLRLPGLVLFDDGATGDEATAERCCTPLPVQAGAGVGSGSARLVGPGPAADALAASFEQRQDPSSGTASCDTLFSSAAGQAATSSFSGTPRAAAPSTSGPTILSGLLRPREALSIFRGQRAAGTWALQVTDRAKNNLTGEVLRWGIVLRTRPCEKSYAWTRLFPPPAPGGGGSGSGGSSQYVAALPPLQGVPPARIDATAVVVGSSWFLWGGTGSASSYSFPSTRDLWRYDAPTNRWTQLHAPLADASGPGAVDALLASAHVAFNGILGPGLGRHAALTSVGLVTWGGLPHSSVAQRVAASQPGFPLLPEADACPVGAGGGGGNATVGYACEDPALVTMVWDFASQLWVRLHPSLPPAGGAGAGVAGGEGCVGSAWCETPPLLRHFGFTVVGDAGQEAAPMAADGDDDDGEGGSSTPSLLAVGGADTASGSVQDPSHIWSLPLAELTALGRPFPPLPDVVPLGSDRAASSSASSTAWREVCWPYMLPDSTAHTDFALRCLRTDGPHNASTRARVRPTATSTATTTATPSPLYSTSATSSGSGSSSPSASSSGSPSTSATGSASSTTSGTTAPSGSTTGTASPSESMTASGSGTGTSSLSPSQSADATPSATQSVSGSGAASASSHPTSSASHSGAASTSPSTTSSATTSASATATQSLSASGTASQAFSATATRSHSGSFSASGSAHPTESGSGTATASGTASTSASGSGTASGLPSHSGSGTATATASPSTSGDPTTSPSATTSATSSGSAAVSPSSTPSGTASGSAAATVTTSSTASGSRSGAASVTSSATASGSAEASASPSGVATRSSTASASGSGSPTASASATATASTPVFVERPVGKPCTYEEVLRRAWCERAFQGVGMI